MIKYFLLLGGNGVCLAVFFFVVFFFICNIIFAVVFLFRKYLNCCNVSQSLEHRQKKPFRHIEPVTNAVRYVNFSGS